METERERAAVDAGRIDDPHEGITVLYRERYASMVRLAYLLTGSNEAAEELVQDAFVKVHRRWDRAYEPAAYLRTAVVNNCRSWHRRRFLERDRRPHAAPEAVEPSEPDHMWEALGALQPRQRAALVLKFYEDLSEEQIASALGCRPGTVKSLVHRGLAELRKVVEP
ncbi:MAG TPA: SigE family RNA polymerase sigma factor [Acidimicrobiia bacterium]|nr:SigE family RNA polymerase sigma factor [Acidimicrobiia bacterium]